MASAQEIAVPSGADVALFDVIIEENPGTARFRFHVPAIDPNEEALTFTDVVEDFEFLCNAVVVPALARNSWGAGDVVISFSAEEVPFGESAPDVRQFFQPFRVEDGQCAWQEF